MSDFLAPCDCHVLALAATASDCLTQPEPSKQLLLSSLTLLDERADALVHGTFAVNVLPHSVRGVPVVKGGCGTC